jgi:protease-4
MAEQNNEIPWERQLVRDMVFTMHKEQVKDRRYRMALKILRSSALILLLVTVYMLGAGASDKTGIGGNKQTSHTAYINIQGEIASGSDADADRLIPAIQSAFENTNAKAVVLRINSPGGSPVHSGRIYEEIRAQKALHPEKKVYAVIGDIGASGGYYIAAAADEIYADQASLVGSIGVISSGFGFTGLMEKLGIERRAITAGKNKALLDPFAPVDERTLEFWRTVLDNTHQQFIARVKAGRGERLATDPEIFTGLIWNGEQALEIGLVDGLGSMNSLARDEIGETNLVDYTPSRDFFQTLSRRARVAVSSFVTDTSVRVY